MHSSVIVLFSLVVVVSSQFGRICHPPCAANEVCRVNATAAECFASGTGCNPNCTEPRSACYVFSQQGQPRFSCNCPNGGNPEMGCRIDPRAPVCPDGCPSGTRCVTDLNNLGGFGVCADETLCEMNPCAVGSCRILYNDGATFTDCYCENGGSIAANCDDAVCGECNRPHEYCGNSTDIFGVVSYFCACDAGYTRNIFNNQCENSTFVIGCNNGFCSDPSEICDPTYLVCVCRPGFVRNASGICEPIPLPPVVIPGSCYGSGDPHYSSFGGSYFDVQFPRCDFILARGPDFMIAHRIGSCNPLFTNSQVSCVLGVAFQYMGTIYEVEGNNFYVNGTLVSLPYSAGGVTATAGISITLSNGVAISAFPYSVHITVPPALQGQISGLCGPYDNIPNNDFTSRGGLISSSLNNNFITSWMLDSSDPQLFRNTHPECISKRSAQKRGGFGACSINDAQAFIPDCMPIYDLRSSPCAPYMNLEFLFAQCLYDACAFGGSNLNSSQWVITAAHFQCQFLQQALEATTGNPTTSAPTTGAPTTGAPTTGAVTTTGQNQGTTTGSLTTTGSMTTAQAGSTSTQAATTEADESAAGRLMIFSVIYALLLVALVL